MPLYEYRCRDCRHEFELLVRESTRLACPACDSAALEKQLSIFAVGAAAPKLGASPAPAPCGSCGDPRGPGACAMD